MRYLFIIATIIGAFWLGSYAFEHAQDVTITWGDSMSITLTSTTLLIATVLGLIGLYLLVTILKALFGLRKRLKKRKLAKLAEKAKQEMTQGLVQFTEGHWKESEKLLVNSIAYSETPLINYLAAARAAHIQEAYDRRDKYLKKASQQGEDAHIAVAVSQAEMQYSCGQTEQARATLIHLREIAPKHPYANKLLAKVYYKQEDWNNLFELLPELSNLSLINDSDREKYEVTALTGIFQMLAAKQDAAKLQGLWKKLPADIREKPDAVLLYCKALSEAGEQASSDKLLVATINKQWDEKLIERYGLIEHKKLNAAIKQGEKWLLEHEKSPMLLLALARLHRKNQLWGKSKTYYNASLNIAPLASAYLEFAELLEELNETENAQICYQYGLRYSIYKKGEILSLKSVNHSDPKLAVVPETDKDIYSI
jgi:HemY protein